MLKIIRALFFKNLSILPMDDLNNEAIALFTFRYFTKTLPATFNHFFKSNNHFHKHDLKSTKNAFAQIVKNILSDLKDVKFGTTPY